MALDLSGMAGRVAVVTGASGGLGLVIVEDLLQAGIKVVGFDVNLEPAEGLATRLEGSPSPSAGSLHLIKVDISDDAGIKDAFKWIDDTLGPVAVMVNCAGLVAMQKLEDTSNETMVKIINSNLLGLMACSREAINSMKRHHIKDGLIININSTTGHAGRISRLFVETWHTIAYIAAKHGVTGFSQALRSEAREHNIRVTSLSPGTIRTPFVLKEYEELLEGRLLEASEVARAVRFVISSPPTVEIPELTIQPAGEVW